MTKSTIGVVLTLLCLSSTHAQVNSNEIKLQAENGLPAIIQFNETKVTDELPAINIFLKSQYQTNGLIEFRQSAPERTDQLNFKIQKLQQYYNGIKVEFGIFNAVSAEGELRTISGDFFVIDELSTEPALSEAAALEKALAFIGANQYMWQKPQMEAWVKTQRDDPEASYFPKGELVVLSIDQQGKTTTPRLVYKFDIYASEPISRSDYYVDAQTGEVVFESPIINLHHHDHDHGNGHSHNNTHVDFVPGTADTRFSGQRTIETEQVRSSFRLRDNSRGDGITTFNLNGGGDLSAATHLVDNDNNWTSAEYNNINNLNSLLDVHWGTMMTYDYFLQEHGRNSLDNNGYRLKSYANGALAVFGLQDDNALWDGENMIYGRGDFWPPFVTLDIVAHEIGHGLDEFTSGLIYSGESGALDEGLADIWSVLVKNHTDPNKPLWEHASELGAAFRDMSDPKAIGQPDTYQGQFWTNASSLHADSGVLAHWFYLLAQGSASTDEINDLNNTFSITGIGLDKAADIVYRAQTLYFTPSTSYPEARSHMIQAAQDLFGATSQEAIEANNAWYAVGIGNEISGMLGGDDYTCYNISSTFTLGNSGNVPVTWTKSSNLTILSSNNSSITVRASSNSVRGPGWVKATMGGDEYTKDMWVGKPDQPVGTIQGPDGVALGATVNYTGPATLGAEGYMWYLPHPFNASATVQTNPTQWGILDGGTSRWLYAQAGPQNGLVQFMATNKCGTGASIDLPVTVGGSSGGGNIPKGGDNIPFTSLFGSDNAIRVFPNPATQQLNVFLSTNTDSDVTLFNASGKVISQQHSKDYSAKFNVADLPNGIYFVKVVGELSAVKRVIVQN